MFTDKDRHELYQALISLAERIIDKSYISEDKKICGMLDDSMMICFKIKRMYDDSIKLMKAGY